MIRMCGGVPVVIPTSHEEHFKITPEQLRAAVTEKTKAIILNNPSNPTGMIYNKDELAALAAVCVEADLYIVADEIYYLSDRCFVCLCIYNYFWLSHGND